MHLIKMIISIGLFEALNGAPTVSLFIQLLEMHLLRACGVPGTVPGPELRDKETDGPPGVESHFQRLSEAL